MFSSIIIFLIVGVPLSFFNWLRKHPKQRHVLSGVISRNIYNSAEQSVHLTAFGVRLILFVVGYFSLLIAVLVIVGGR